jgi:hypothetical protein
MKSLLNQGVVQGVKSLVHRAEAAAPEALHAAARDAAEGLADRLALAAPRPPESLFPRTAVGLAVASQAAQDRLAPVIKQAGRTMLFAPDRYGVLDLRAYQLGAAGLGEGAGGVVRALRLRARSARRTRWSRGRVVRAGR